MLTLAEADMLLRGWAIYDGAQAPVERIECADLLRALFATVQDPAADDALRAQLQQVYRRNGGRLTPTVREVARLHEVGPMTAEDTELYRGACQTQATLAAVRAGVRAMDR